MKAEKILIDEILKYKSPRERILITLSVVGIATTGQLIRLCLEMSPKEKEILAGLKSKGEKYAEIREMAMDIRNREGYVGREKKVILPKYMGGGITHAWFITEKGVAATKIINPYFTRFTAPGLPCNGRKDRIPHELAVTESFLTIVADEDELLQDFIPERELKRRLLKKRHDLLRQGINPKWHPETKGEETGDFKVVLLPFDDRNAYPATYECETAVNYRRAQIEAKPDRMHWFVTSTTQQDVVIAAKKGALNSISIIGHVRAPLMIEKNKPIKKARKMTVGGRPKLRKKIADFLMIKRQAFTGKTLAAIFKEKLSHISATLTKLAAEGIVISDEIKLTPARRRGRPNKLFWHSQVDEHIEKTRTSRVTALMLSELIVYAALSEYRFNGYYASLQQADFAPLDTHKNFSISFVLATPEITIEEVRRRVESVRVKSNGILISYVSVCTIERHNDLRPVLSNCFVYNVELKKLFQPHQY